MEKMRVTKFLFIFFFFFTTNKRAHCGVHSVGNAVSHANLLMLPAFFFWWDLMTSFFGRQVFSYFVYNFHRLTQNSVMFVQIIHMRQWDVPGNHFRKRNLQFCLKNVFTRVRVTQTLAHSWMEFCTKIDVITSNTWTDKLQMNNRIEWNRIE